MITEYPFEHRRYDGSEFEPFRAAVAALEMPLSLYMATRRQGRIRAAAKNPARRQKPRVETRRVAADGAGEAS